VTQAGYTDLVGTLTDNYIRSISQVAGEDYSTILIQQGTTQVSITSPTFGTVTYNL
jgi:hypothetical protein